MNKITCKFCGTNTSHTKSHYFTRVSHSEYSVSDYLLMFFKTPYLYKDIKDEISSGEEYSYILYPPFTSAEHGSKSVGFVNDWIFFGGLKAKEIIEEFGIPFCEPFKIDDYSIIEPYINRIETELKFKNKCYESEISALAEQMLIDLGRQFDYKNRNVHPAFAAIFNARTYMLNHIEEKISVKELAERANYSVSRFCVLYNEFFSVTPVEDLLNARIQKAVSLLKYDKTSITEIAERCGFSSIHYFSRKFKEKTGVSPSEYSK